MSVSPFGLRGRTRPYAAPVGVHDVGRFRSKIYKMPGVARRCILKVDRSFALLWRQASSLLRVLFPGMS